MKFRFNKGALPYGALLLLSVLLMWGYVSGARILLTTDGIIANSSFSFGEMLRSLNGGWRPSPLLGSNSGGGIPVASVAKGLFSSGVAWNNLVHALGCLLASFLLFAFLNRKLDSRLAALGGVVTAFWLGSNFTLMYAGHPHKPFVLLFFVLSILLLGSKNPVSVYQAILFGAAVGLMFVQQPDLAMFCALFSGSYLIFRLWKGHGWAPVEWAKRILPALVLALLFAVGPLLGGYKNHVKGSAQMQTQDAGAKWDYVTQWSFPPDETIAFIAPGYTGWRSGEADGPYWGRMGRSPEWEASGKGFRNFKLENTYLGFIPLCFAIFALVTCRRSKNRAEILFWGGAAFVALLLSFGKFFPLYRLFYALPVVNNIRNPNKFLQVFQICLAIMSAYGLDALLGLRSHRSNAKERATNLVVLRRFFWGVLIFCVGGLIWVSMLALTRDADVIALASQGWASEQAQTIAGNRIRSLTHMLVVGVLVTAALALFAFEKCRPIRGSGRWVLASLVILIAVDAKLLSRHYVKEMPSSYIKKNALTRFLDANLGQERVALASQQGIYGLKLAYLLKYNRISTFNFSDMPRMATEYQAYLQAGSKAPLNMWRFGGVKLLMAPTAMAKQIPASQAEKVFAYSARPAPDGGYTLHEDPVGPFSVFELKGSLSRFSLWAGARPASDEEVLASIARNPSQRPAVLTAPDSNLPALNGKGQVGDVEIVSYRDGNVSLRVSTPVPAVLRCADRFDENWKAKLDGEPIEVSRVDYLCTGISVPEGLHEIVIWHSRSRLFIGLQAVGFILVLGTCCVESRSRKRKSA
jgi:hypothetical protein